MTEDTDNSAMVQRANDLAQELVDAVRRPDWDQVFLISQTLQQIADALSAQPKT